MSFHALYVSILSNKRYFGYLKYRLLNLFGGKNIIFRYTCKKNVFFPKIYEYCRNLIIFASKFIELSTKEKLIERFKRQPKDFTWNELVRLFGIFGFAVNNKGKTSGSRVMFEKGEETYVVHKPHPSKIIKEYSMKQILEYFKKKKLINNN